MGKRPKSARAQRREGARDAEKLADARVKLARLEPGGAASTPIVVESASVVEGAARSMPCARCGGSVRVTEHRVAVIDGSRLRVVAVDCGACGFRREVYFALPLLS
jgi:hypothetical protein